MNGYSGRKSGWVRVLQGQDVRRSGMSLGCAMDELCSSVVIQSHLSIDLFEWKHVLDRTFRVQHI